MQSIWINPYSDLNTVPELPDLADDTLLTMDIHRNIVPLKVVNTARYQNGPLPVLAPATPPRHRKISTAPPRCSKSR